MRCHGAGRCAGDRFQALSTAEEWYFIEKSTGVGYGSHKASCDGNKVFCAGGKTFGPDLSTFWIAFDTAAWHCACARWPAWKTMHMHRPPEAPCSVVKRNRGRGHASERAVRPAEARLHFHALAGMLLCLWLFVVTRPNPQRGFHE